MAQPFYGLTDSDLARSNPDPYGTPNLVDPYAAAGVQAGLKQMLSDRAGAQKAKSDLALAKVRGDSWSAGQVAGARARAEEGNRLRTSQVLADLSMRMPDVGSKYSSGMFEDMFPEMQDAAHKWEWNPDQARAAFGNESLWADRGQELHNVLARMRGIDSLRSKITSALAQSGPTHRMYPERTDPNTGVVTPASMVPNPVTGKLEPYINPDDTDMQRAVLNQLMRTTPLNAEALRTMHQQIAGQIDPLAASRQQQKAQAEAQILRDWDAAGGARSGDREVDLLAARRKLANTSRAAWMQQPGPAGLGPAEAALAEHAGTGGNALGPAVLSALQAQAALLNPARAHDLAAPQPKGLTQATNLESFTGAYPGLLAEYDLDASGDLDDDELRSMTRSEFGGFRQQVAGSELRKLLSPTGDYGAHVDQALAIPSRKYFAAKAKVSEQGPALHGAINRLLPEAEIRAAFQTAELKAALEADDKSPTEIEEAIQEVRGGQYTQGGFVDWVVQHDESEKLIEMMQNNNLLKVNMIQTTFGAALKEKKQALTEYNMLYNVLMRSDPKAPGRQTPTGVSTAPRPTTPLFNPPPIRRNPN